MVAGEIKKLEKAVSLLGINKANVGPQRSRRGSKNSRRQVDMSSGSKRILKGKKSASGPRRRVESPAKSDAPNRKAQNVMVNEGVKLSNKNVARNEISAVVSSLVCYPGENFEDINVMINPHLLAQFIVGILARSASGDDSSYFNNNLPAAVNYFMANVQNPTADFCRRWPKRILELASLLGPKRYGSVRYTANWGMVQQWVLDASQTGANGGMVNSGTGFSLGKQGSVASNLILPAPYTTGALSATNMEEFLARYAGGLNLVDINSMLTPEDDCSAYAWDVATPVNVGNINPNNTGLYVSVGASTTAVNYVVPQDSAVSLEVPIKTPWAARLRLGTELYNSFVITTPRLNVSVQQRRTGKTLPVSCGPAAVGASLHPHKREIRGIIQLKQVPVTALVQQILNKLEFMSTLLNLGTAPTWAASWTASDVKMLAYFFYKRWAMERCGYHFGTGIAANGTFTYAAPYQNHVGMSSAVAFRVPEYIGRLIGSENEYSDSLGTLIPWHAPIDVNALSTSVTYTLVAGANDYAAALPQEGGFLGVTNMTYILGRWKSFEPYFAQVTNLMLFGELGPTYLDTTFVRGTDPSSDSLLNLKSRRPLDDNAQASLYDVIAGISYETIQGASAANSGQGIQGSKDFRQRYRRDLNGFDTFTGILTATIKDGVVVGALTSNISDANGPDNQPYERIPAVGSSIAQLATRWGASYGNYGGYKWTAGKIVSPGENPPMSQGKYTIPAIDLEDELYKRHDEDYHFAKTKADTDVADKRLVDGLNKLEKTSALGWMAKKYFDKYYYLHEE